MKNKPIVFVIMPFNEDFLALYEDLKSFFSNDFDFINAKDLDNQQNVLKDIVEGIHIADVIIADLTGLNANVFYELGLAHAMNKKVVIITQDINTLPFDIKSYRANEYSLKFYKLPLLREELKKLLFGAIDNSVQYGNPVSDYLPAFANKNAVEHTNNESNETDNDTTNDGFLDYLSDINEYEEKLSLEISSMVAEITDMSSSITNASYEMNRVSSHGGNIDINFVRGICRKLSTPIDSTALNLKGHISNIDNYWSIIENGYLAILDSQFIQNQESLNELDGAKQALMEMQYALDESNISIDSLIASLRGSLGVERKLNKAILSLIAELESYLSMSDTILSSIDRIIAKSVIAIANIKKSLD